MGLLLKFRKHCLTEKGSSELLHKIIYEIKLFLRVFFRFEQIFHKKGFVACGSNLCHKYFMTRIYKGLFFPCRVAVEGVAHLVGYGEHTVYRVVMI